MARLTRPEDEFECRCSNCLVEEWIYDFCGKMPTADICKSCPFMKYINRLAEYEDKEEEACRKAVKHVLAVCDVNVISEEEYKRIAMHNLKHRFDKDLIEKIAFEQYAIDIEKEKANEA